ncbi:MAG: winged helix-turn-helix transcriptional regulator [Gammaproteobacteria bacterium]|nr:winged helix-turn-helix transcriptional regulator [Gammaproteobacteria bacterium]MBV9696913.1 winged helix-turn-helix transcriptional regulator [Gammaproteobacteria bacterium]
MSPDLLVRWLKAAGESTRLRLLGLCTEGALGVSELAETLHQSEPRVSRHLRVLADAGLIERQRQGQWAHYRLRSDPEVQRFVRGLLPQADGRDARLARDRAVLAARRRDAAVGPDSRLGRALAAFCAPSQDKIPPGAICLMGSRHPELLASAAALGRETLALAGSRRAAQALRMHADGLDVPCRVLEMRSFSARDLARAGAPFAALFLDASGLDGRELTAVLERIPAALLPGARAFVFAGYESLEGQRVVEHPLARLRRLLQEAGLACERLSPLEADGEHVLAAVALRAEPVPAARGVA